MSNYRKSSKRQLHQHMPQSSRASGRDVRYSDDCDCRTCRRLRLKAAAKAAKP